MDFKTAATLGAYLAKDHAEPLFRLLVDYTDISASEAGSRLGLHIRTAQDFLETMAALGILEREEVFEKKRPYYRYTLQTDHIRMDVDLTSLRREENPESRLAMRIRERKGAGARFSTARSGTEIASVTIWTGEGRGRNERRLNLTTPQGRFLYHLPFPDAEFQTVAQIMDSAGVDTSHTGEIVDMVQVLEEHGVIHSKNRETP